MLFEETTREALHAFIILFSASPSAKILRVR
jgi:hypothetical protein